MFWRNRVVGLYAFCLQALIVLWASNSNLAKADGLRVTVHAAWLEHTEDLGSAPHLDPRVRWKPLSFPLQFTGSKKNQDYWYRITYEAPATASQPILYLPRVQTQLEVLIQSRVIHKYGSTKEYTPHLLQAIPIDSPNEPIYIRTQTSLALVGISGTPEVTTYPNLVRKMIHQEYDRIIASIALLSLAASLLLIWLFDRRTFAHLYLAAFSLAVGFYLFALTQIKSLVIAGPIWGTIGMPLLYLAPAAFGAYIQSAIGASGHALKLFTRIHALFFVVSLASGPLLPAGIRSLFLPFQVILLLFMVSVLAVVVRRGRKDRYVRILGIGLSILACTVVHDILWESGFLPTVKLVSWGILAFTASLAAIQGLRFVDLHREVVAQRSALEKKNKELQALDELKDDFLANTSHELRTPLHGILGLSENLEETLQNDGNEEILGDLSLIRSSAHRLSMLVEQLLDFSRAKKHELVLKMTKIDLRLVVDHVTKSLKKVASDKNITLVNELSPYLPKVYGDENRLVQVLFNVLGNALKFTEKGGVTIEASSTDKSVTLTVTDTGIGIHQEELPKIFDAFTQADSSANRNYGGTGLGLAIVRDLVKAMGGKIRAESELGKGSKFHIELRRDSTTTLSGSASEVGEASYSGMTRDTEERDKQDPVESLVGVISSKTHSSTMVAKTSQPKETESDFESLNREIGEGTVLVVDDEPINLRVVKRHLEEKGVRCLTANSGAQAIAMIEREKPSVVLLDVMMPLMNGYEVCQWIRARYTIDQLPVIFLTAKNQQKDVERGFEQGASDFLTKPFSNRELTQRIRVHGKVTALTSALRAALATVEKTAVLEAELKAARIIQESFLPEKIHSPEFDIATFYSSGGHAGGDLLFYHHDPKTHRLILFVGDVTGHDLAAALVNAVCLGVLNSYASTQRYRGQGDSLIAREIAESIHEAIATIGGNAAKMMTAFIATLNTQTGQGACVNAGHPRPLIIGPTQTRSLKTPPSSILGRAPIECAATPLSLRGKESLLVFTDGLVDNNPKAARAIRRRRMHLSCTDQTSATSITQAIESLISEAPQGDSEVDDCCFLVLTLKKANATAASEGQDGRKDLAS